MGYAGIRIANQLNSCLHCFDGVHSIQWLALLNASNSVARGAKESKTSVCILASCLSVALLAVEVSNFNMASNCGVLVTDTFGKGY